MKSMHRLMIKGFKRNLPGAQVEVVSQRGHYVFAITFNGVTRKVATSGTPKVEHHAVINACRDACKAFGAEYVGV